MGTLPAHSFPGIRAAEDGTLKGDDEDVIYVGKPDGPIKYILELDMEVPTYIDPCEHLRLPKDSGTTWLMHHVPRNKRGFYKANQIPQKWREANPAEWQVSRTRVDNFDFVLCHGVTRGGNSCNRRAVNFSGYCQAHGGKLHPLDKVVNEKRTGMMNAQLPTEVRQGMPHAERNPELVARMTRWQMLLSGMITVDDLDDEELAQGQCRGRDGKFHGAPPRDIPKDLKDRMVKKIFERVEVKMRTALPEMIDVLIAIAGSDVYEAGDRIKAATWIAERMMGKVPDKVIHAQDKPWQVLLGGISGGSRALSRVNRGVADEEEILEAQVVDIGVSDSGDNLSGPSVVGDILDHSVVDRNAPLVGDEDVEEAIPDPLSTPTFRSANDDQPRHPVEADNLAFRAEQERLATRELAKELKQKRKDALRARIIAREQGFKSVRPVPFVHTTKKRDDLVFHRFRMPRVSADGKRTT